VILFMNIVCVAVFLNLVSLALTMSVVIVAETFLIYCCNKKHVDMKHKFLRPQMNLCNLI
jgi:hypothetical protein